MAATRLGPFTNLTGSGGPDFFRTLNLTGWVKDWSPRDSTYGEHALLVAEATPNPALVLDLSAEITNAQVEAACSVFGPVEEVFRPQGASFVFVRFKSDADAAKCTSPSGGLNIVDGCSVRVQPAKQCSAEISKWRRELLGQHGGAADVGC